MYILSFLASLVKGVKRAFAQTVLSLEAENRFPSSWNLKIQKLVFECLLRIRTDTISKGYQHVRMCLIIKISLKEVRRTIKLLCILFWKDLASSTEKKREISCFSFLIVIWKDKFKQFFVFIHCQLNESKKSEKTFGNRNLQTERERSKKLINYKK